MPRVVDHVTKRQDLVDAALRVIVRDGLEAATVRTIAAEAGTSIRPVQYYFDDKAALLALAHARVTELLGTRIANIVRALGDNPEPRAVVDAVVHAFLPTDRESRDAMVAYYAFYAAEMVDARVRIRGAKRAPNLIAELIVAQLRRAGVDGPELSIDVQLFVFALPSAASGVIAGYLSLKDARAVLDRGVDALFRTPSASR